MFCEHCEKETGLHVDAIGFCENCFEYMCETCLRFHIKYERKHTVKDRYHMPRNFCTLKCKIHPKEIVKFYCRRCDKIACAVCKKDCSSWFCSVKFIPDIIQLENFARNASEVQGKLQKLRETLFLKSTTCDICVDLVPTNAEGNLEQIRLHKEKLKEEIEFQKREIINDFDRRKEELIRKLDRERAEKLDFLTRQTVVLNTQLDTTEGELQKELGELKNKDLLKLRAQKEEITDLQSKLETLQDNLNAKYADAGVQKCDHFLAEKSTKQALKGLENDCNNLLKDNYSIVFRASDNFDIELQSQTDLLGRLMKHKSCTEKRKLYRTYKINLVSTDAKNSNVSICQVFDSRLVVSNQKKKSLTLIDMEHARILYIKTLSSAPHAVTSVKEDTVVLSLPEDKKIAVFSITTDNQVITAQEITVGDACYGITYNNLDLYCTTDRGLIMYNIINGDMKHIEFSPGQCLNTLPAHAVVNARLRKIYVSDRNVVKSFSFEGVLLHMSSVLEVVHGLTADRSGALYVLAEKKVLQVSYDLSMVHNLLEYNSDEIFPRSLYYCDEQDKLYVYVSKDVMSKIYVYEVD